MKLIEKYKPLFQKVPLTRYFVITGGRGSAKSFHVAMALVNLTYEKGHVILFTRWTMVSAHISIIPEFIDKIERLGVTSDFEITQNEIYNNKTGSRIIFKGIKTSQGTATANLKSISGVTTFVLDEAEELIDEDVFDRIDLSIREKSKPNRVILIMNPSYKNHFVYKRWFEKKRTDTTYIHTTYIDNYFNLSDSFLIQAEQTKKTNNPRYKHLFHGDWLDDAEGMFWNRKIIERQRIEIAPQLARVIVAIDPATTADKNSDETGIVVVGKNSNNHYFILADLSGKFSPLEWATVAGQAVFAYKADCIVAEKNQGGEMVQSVLRQVDKRTRIKLVHASKGKSVRAEPIYSLYEQGLVWHVGNLPTLEFQMVTFNPDSNKQSPDRVDALVWGLTEIMAKKQPLPL